MNNQITAMLQELLKKIDAIGSMVQDLHEKEMNEKGGEESEPQAEQGPDEEALRQQAIKNIMAKKGQ